MFPLEIDITKENIEQRMAKRSKRDILTGIKLFANHNGLRKNKFHLLIAPTGVGKSTFVRTVLIDFIENNPEMKVLLWLTEETREDFEDEFSFGINERVMSNLDNLSVISEQSMTIGESGDDVRKYVSEIVDHYDYDLIIMDNITTSKLYLGATPKEQEYSASWLKSLCKNDLALLGIAHTGGGVTENGSKLLDENDIRGNKTLPNLVEFLYILQPFFVGNRLYQFLITKKHRGQKIHSKYIGIKYDKETSTFKESAYVDFEELKRAFKQRNQLSDK